MSLICCDNQMVAMGEPDPNGEPHPRKICYPTNEHSTLIEVE